MNLSITGIDDLSQKILEELHKGVRVSEIPTIFPVSIDQAKRLSRYNTMLNLAKDNLEEAYYERLHTLGLKALPLSNMFKKSEWIGIKDILGVVTNETTRDELQLLVRGSREKQKRIQEFKEQADILLKELESNKAIVIEKEKEILRIKQEMNEKVNMFNNYPKHMRPFFLEYLGLHEGNLILAKRLNVNWQRQLKKQNIITYDSLAYMHFIKDFDSFVESLKNRIARKLDYKWDPEKDLERLSKTSLYYYDVPEDGKYKVATSFNEPFQDSINLIEKQLKEIAERKAAINKELANMKSKTIHSYLEMAEISDFLSVINLKKHKELQNLALKWLFNRGYIAIAEFTLPNGRRADIFAYNESEIIILEIKVSMGDLKSDTKWRDYLSYCDSFYFLTTRELQYTAKEKINGSCGLFISHNDTLKLFQADTRKNTEIVDKELLKTNVARKLSQKYIYGF